MRNKKRIATAITIILSCIMVMAGCTHEPQVPAVTVSFRADIQPIIQADCAINGSCHLGANNANDQVNFDSSVAYSTILTKHLVSSGSPSASLLYVEVSTGVMPKAPYGPLSSAQISLISTWIKQGAPDN